MSTYLLNALDAEEDAEEHEVEPEEVPER